MNPNRKHHAATVDGKDATLQEYLEIFWWRKWWFFLPVFLGTAIAIMVSYTLSPQYRSSTLILVEPQKVPSAYVSSTITSSVEDRLNTISQQILSRTNLEKIIREFGLYKPNATKPTGLERVATSIRRRVKDILASTGLYEQQDASAWVPARYVERMRNATEITVIGGGGKNAFTVAYSGTDPETVRRVTNTLASLFIEENLKIRERQAEGTTQFLAGELAIAEGELQRLEQRLKEFKERHKGALPEQLDANLRTLDRFQLQLQTINSTLRTAEEKRLFYAQQLQNDTDTLVPEGSVQPSQTPRGAELEQLRRDLVRLRAQFNDTYPDIVLLKNRIKEVKEQLTSAQPVEDIAVGVPQVKSQVASTLEAQMSLLDSEINALKESGVHVREQIAAYEKRLEATYENELKTFTLTRDYDISKGNYETILTKSLNAKMSENLERKQKGEQFRVLDPANLPTEPFKPDRTKIILLGGALSGALGAGVIFLLEFLQPSFRKPEDLQRSVELATLVIIPHNSVTQKKKHRSLIAVEASDSIITEQYRILYTKLNELQREREQKIFAISSAIQGEGKTVTALNLAVVTARDFGQKTLLLEGDFKAPSLASYLKAELESGLVDLLMSNTDIQSTSIPFADTLIPFAHDNLSVLPVLKSVGNSSGLLSSQRMRDLLEMFKEQYDCILIDAPPVLTFSDMNVFEEVVDGIILVVRAEKTSRDTLTKAIEELATEKLVGIVFNDSQQPLPGYQRFAHMKV